MHLRSLPKVSVLVPAYNEEKYILQTLQALVNQDYPYFEIIIADNASSDKTAAIVENFINTRPATGIFITLVYEARRGTNFARERARLSATGSVIAQLDADCIPPTNWLSSGVAALCHKSKKRVAVTGPYDYFDGEKKMRKYSLLLQKMFYPAISFLTQKAGRAAILIGGNAFIRAEILTAAGGYDTTLTFYGDDIDLGRRLARYGYVAYIGTLIQRSSSRRYVANGFTEVNKKYISTFCALIWTNRNDTMHSFESSHPR